MRGGFRGGFRGGSGRGGFGLRGRGAAASLDSGAARLNSKLTFSDDDTAASASAATASLKIAQAAAKNKASPAVVAAVTTPSHVTKTIVTADGSEIPQRLNNKVFVDGLPFHHTPKPGEGTLEDQLAQFVQDWKVGRVMHLSKKDGQGFGYLAFRSPNSVDVAVRVLNGRKFLGRHLRVEAPKAREEGKSATGDGQGEEGNTNIGASSFGRQILLSDLAKIAQPEIIREVLRDVAPQLEERIVAIKMCGGNRKAFLTLREEGDVEPGVRFLNGFSLFGRNVCAERAMPPGSLPYSKARPISKQQEGFSAGSGAAAAQSLFSGADDEIELVPLGAAPAAAPSRSSAAAVPARKPPSSAAPAAVTSAVAAKYNSKDNGPREVYVGNISDSTTAAQLRTHFSTCGMIHQCELMYNPATKLPLGIAKIEFAAPASAGVAQQNLHGSRLNGSVLRVDRGAEISAPLASEKLKRTLQEDVDADAVDEDALLQHHGVRNKNKYFQGTSFEEVSQQKKKKKSKLTATTGSKRSREVTGEGSSESIKLTKKKLRTDELASPITSTAPKKKSTKSSKTTK